MSKGKIALGAVFGVVTGFVAGILTAPKSGKETRDELKETAIKGKDAALAEVEKVKATAQDKTQEAKAKAEEVIDEVADRAVELKDRAEQAFEGAKKGFAKKPTTNKKK